MNSASDHLPTGTPVLNIMDGEVGTILNGFAFDPALGWTEYEVATRFGIERWVRGNFVALSELGNDPTELRVAGANP